MLDTAQLDRAALDPEARALIEEYLGIQKEILAAADRGALSIYTPYPHQLRLHQASESSRYLLGANKIGKSWFIAQEVRYFARGEHPYRRLNGPAKLIWCCCPTEELMLMYQFPEVKAALGTDFIQDIKMGAHPRILCKNGCLILFKYYAQGARAFPTAGVDLICFDEEPPWAVFEECWARRSTRELNFIGAITTIGGKTPFIKRIVDGEMPDCRYETASIFDNPAIPDSEKKRFADGLRKDPVAYRIRVLGEVLDVGGTTRFDANSLYLMDKVDVREPIARFRYDFDNLRWVQDETGPLWIWEMPEDEHEYVIGGDVAEGLNVSESETDPVWDNTSLQVMNRTYERIVAEYTVGNQEPGQIGEHILPSLHRLYGKAWANIELNNHGYTVVSEARKKMANRLWSPIKDHADKAQKPLQQLGSLMTSKSRKYAIDCLAQAIYERGQALKYPDKEGGLEVLSGHTLREMMQFVRKSNNRVEHADGEKDDRVFACAHAVVCHRGLPPPKIRRPPTIQEQLRKIAMSRPKNERRVQWFRKIA